LSLLSISISVTDTCRGWKNVTRYVGSKRKVDKSISVCFAAIRIQK
jgi:hypothetical protein